MRTYGTIRLPCGHRHHGSATERRLFRRYADAPPQTATLEATAQANYLCEPPSFLEGSALRLYVVQLAKIHDLRRAGLEYWATAARKRKAGERTRPALGRADAATKDALDRCAILKRDYGMSARLAAPSGVEARRSFDRRRKNHRKRSVSPSSVALQTQVVEAELSERRDRVRERLYHLEHGDDAPPSPAKSEPSAAARRRASVARSIMDLADVQKKSHHLVRLVTGRKVMQLRFVRRAARDVRASRRSRPKEPRRSLDRMSAS